MTMHADGQDILVMAPYLTRRHSGAAQSTINAINALHDGGDRVHVLAFEIEPDVLARGVSTTILPAPPLRRALWRIGRLMLVRDYRIALGTARLPKVAWTYTQSMEFALAFRALEARTPLLTHFGHVLAERESRDASDLPQPWREIEARTSHAVEQRCYRLPRTTHVVSTSLVAGMREGAFRLQPGFFPVAPLGLDIDRFSDRSRRVEMRDRLGISEQALVVVAVARMVAWKQLDWVIEAAAALAPTVHDPIHVILVGEGEQEPSLRALARRHEHALRVHFAGHVDPVPFLAAADVFALPSTIESFGMAYAEAMSMGLPCIGLRNDPPAVLSSAQDVIEHGVTGMLVSSVEELTAALRHVAPPHMREAMGARSSRKARHAYASAHYAERLRALAGCYPPMSGELEASAVAASIVAS